MRIPIIVFCISLSLTSLGQERCRNAFAQKGFGSTKLREQVPFLEFAAGLDWHWANPNLDSVFSLQRIPLQFSVGRSARKNIEWSLLLRYYYNDLVPFVNAGNPELDASETRHLELGITLGYFLPNRRFQWRSTLGANIAFFPSESFYHISFLQTGMRYFAIHNRKLALFLETSLRANPSYLLGNEWSLITYNTAANALAGLRFYLQ